MKRVKGIILETGDKWATLLTGEGQFIKCLNKNFYLPGMEIEVEYPPVRNKYFIASIAAASIIFVFATLLAFYNFYIPAAYVAVDINPSLLLSLNRCAEIIKVEGVNPDGELFIGNLDLRGKNIEEAMGIIIQKCYAEDYLTSNKDNLIYISLASPEGYPLHEDALKLSACREIVALGLDAYLKVKNVDRRKFLSAKEKNISVNTLLLIEEMEEKGFLEEESSSPDITSDLSIGTLLKNVRPDALFEKKEFIAGKKENGVSDFTAEKQETTLPEESEEMENNSANNSPQKLDQETNKQNKPLKEKIKEKSSQKKLTNYKEKEAGKEPEAKQLEEIKSVNEKENEKKNGDKREKEKENEKESSNQSRSPEDKMDTASRRKIFNRFLY